MGNQRGHIISIHSFFFFFRVTKFGVACSERIEQRAIPMSFIYWCEIVNGTKYDYLLIADNEVGNICLEFIQTLFAKNFQHKFKLLDIDTKVPKTVILAPAFGYFKNQIINKMMVMLKFFFIFF